MAGFGILRTSKQPDTKAQTLNQTNNDKHGWGEQQEDEKEDEQGKHYWQQ